MKNKKFLVALITFIILMLSSTMAYSTEGMEVLSNAERYKWFTIIPPLVAIILAFITKNVVISLFIGTLTGCFMTQFTQYSFFQAIIHSFLDFVQRALNALADPWNAGIILQVLVIGGVIELISKMGGARAIAEELAKKAKTPRSTQFVTWLLGIIVFFDDYANALIVGPIMKPVADKMKVSRERLSFIIDATAAPIAGLAIISTWIGLEVSLISDGFQKIGVEADGFGVFLQTIPYRFYNILIIVFVITTIASLREFGPMRKAEIKARRGEQILKDIKLDEKIEEEMAVKEGIKLSIWNAIIPIGTLVIGALISFYYSGYTSIMSGNNEAIKQIFNESLFSFRAIREAFSNADASAALFQSALLASIVAIALGVFKRIFTISEAIDVWINGMKGLLITGVILILAWSLGGVIGDLGTADFLVSKLSGSVPAFLLPSIIFIFGAIISFSTGTAYGTMTILMPLAIPLSYAINSDMSYIIVSTSAVLTGAIFGDHCSPISDTTILSSMGAGCGHIEHVKTQMWYALFIGLLTIIFGYIPAGFGIPIYIVLPISILAVILCTYFIGKPVEDPKHPENFH